jgi:hypothetical protein
LSYGGASARGVTIRDFELLYKGSGGMIDRPIAFFLPCAACKTEVVASVAMLRSARGFKCPACAIWTDIDAGTVKALETDHQAGLAALRERLQAP